MKLLERYWWLAGLLLAAATVLLSPLASGKPDGLERVAEDAGVSDTATDSPYEALPDYTVPGIQNETLSTVAAGVTGVLAVFLVTYGLSRTLRRKSSRETGQAAAPDRKPDA